MTKPMTPEIFESIKEHYKMAKREGASLHYTMVGHCLDEIEQLTAALEDMCCQFAYWSEKDGGGLWTGGLSALEGAFGVLGWDEPHPVPGMRCDEPGCKKQRVCGWPSPKGYRNTCGEHRDKGADAGNIRTES